MNSWMVKLPGMLCLRFRLYHPSDHFSPLLKATIPTTPTPFLQALISNQTLTACLYFIIKGNHTWFRKCPFFDQLSVYPFHTLHEFVIPDPATFSCLPLFHAVESEPPVMDTRPYPGGIGIVVLPHHPDLLSDLGGLVGTRCTPLRPARKFQTRKESAALDGCFDGIIGFPYRIERHLFSGDSGDR